MLTYRRLGAIVVVALLVLVSFLDAAQYVELQGEHDYYVEDIEEEAELEQFLQMDEGARVTKSTMGTDLEDDSLWLNDYYDWTSEEMSETISVNDLYTYLYLRPLADFELKFDGGSGDESGWNITTLDLTGDDRDDIVIGAPGYDNDRGRVHIFFGSELDMGAGVLDPSNADVTITGESQGDKFGWSVGNASDWNDNGIEDLVVGAPGAGNAYVFYGDDSENWPSTIDLGNGGSADVTISGDAGDEFGASVGGGADLTDNGHPDIFVGEPGAEAERGRIYIYEGAGDANPDFTITGKHEGDRFGHSLAGTMSVSTQTGDWTDLIVGAPHAPHGEGPGRAYIFLGGLAGDVDLSEENADVTLVGESEDDLFGWSVFSAGDVNDDGYGDIVVGAPGWEEDTGRGYVYLGSEHMDHGGAVLSSGMGEPSPVTGLEQDESTISSSNSKTPMSNGEDLTEVVSGISTTESSFGWNVTLVDLNDNGWEDIVVGAPHHDHDGRTDCGAVYIFFGKERPDTWIGEDIDHSNADVTIYGESAEDLFGWDVAGVGDISVNGFNDLIVGAPGGEDGRGAVYVFNGRASWSETIDLGDGGSANDVISGEDEGDKFGASVSTIGGDEGFVAGAWNAPNFDNLLLYTDFEEGLPDGWSTGSWDYTNDPPFTENNWQVGSPSGTNAPSPYEGTNVAGVVIDGNYVNEEGSYLETPVVDIPPEASSATFSFWLYTRIENTYDGLNLKVSIDDGDYQNVTTDLDYDGTLSTSYDNPIGGESAWWIDREWTNVTVNLDEYIGKSVQFRWHWGADTSIVEWGPAIDEVYLLCEGNFKTGRAYIFQETASLPTAGVDADYILNGTSDGDMFGFSLDGGGDVNGDGNYDILIGAPGRDEAYVYYGPDFGTDTTIFSGETGEDFGWSVSFIGGFSGTSSDSVGVGAPGTANGKVYVFSDEDIAEAEGQVHHRTDTDFETYSDKDNVEIMPETEEGNENWDGRVDLTGTDQFFDDFETDLNQWTLYEDGGSITRDSTTSIYGDYSAKLEDTSTSDEFVRMESDDWTAESRGIAEFYVRTDGDGFYFWKAGYSTFPSGWYSTTVLAFLDGKLNYLELVDGDPHFEPIMEYTPNTWYHIQIHYNNNDYTWDVYVNNTQGQLECVEENLSYYNDLNSRKIYIDTDPDLTTTVYVDEVRVSTFPNTPGYLTSSTTTADSDINAVRYTWNTTVPDTAISSTDLWLEISRDGGTTWNESALIEGDWYTFPLEEDGDQLRYRVNFVGDGVFTPILYDIKIEYSFLTPEGEIVGEATGDRFGFSVSGGAFVSGSSAELIAGAPLNDEGGTDAGRVYVFDSIPGTSDAADADHIHTGDAAGDLLGYSVSNVGHVNDDPHADFAVGSPGHDTEKGKTTVLSLHHQVEITFEAETQNEGAYTTQMDEHNPAIVNYVSKGEESVANPYDGNPVSVWADVETEYSYEGTSDASTFFERWYTPDPPSGTADGYYTETGEFYHQFYIIVSTAGGYLSEDPSTTLYWTEEGTSEDKSVYDDISPDEIWMDSSSEFSVETPLQGPTDPRNIKYVCDDDESLVDGPKTHTFLFHAEFPPDVTFDGPGANAQFGWSVIGAGDFDGTGHGDIAIGAPGYDGDTGRAYFFNSTGEWGIGSELVADDAYVIREGEVAGDRFGHSLSKPGDVLGDDIDSVLVGAPYHGNGGADAGRTYLFEMGRWPTITLEYSSTYTSQAFAQTSFQTIQGAEWYEMDVPLEDPVITLDAGDQVELLISVSSDHGYSEIVLSYGDAEFDSHYELGGEEDIPMAVTVIVKTYRVDGEESTPTEEWSPIYDQGEDVEFRAEVTALEGTAQETIAGADITIMRADGEVIVDHTDMGEPTAENGDWMEFEYTFDTTGLDPGLYKAIVRAEGTDGVTDEVYGETNNRMVWFRVVDNT